MSILSNDFIKGYRTAHDKFRVPMSESQLIDLIWVLRLITVREYMHFPQLKITTEEDCIDTHSRVETRQNPLYVLYHGGWTRQLLYQCESEYAMQLREVYQPLPNERELQADVIDHVYRIANERYRLKEEQLAYLAEKYPAVRRARDHLNSIVALAQSGET